MLIGSGTIKKPRTNPALRTLLLQETVLQNLL
jgi:hypothetical protein